MDCNKLMKEALDNYVGGLLHVSLDGVPTQALVQDNLYRFQMNDVYSGSSDILKMNVGDEITLDTPLSTAKSKQSMLDFGKYKLKGMEDFMDETFTPEDYSYVYFKDSQGKQVIDVNSVLGKEYGHLDEQEAIIPKGSKIKKVDSYKEGEVTVNVFKLLGLGSLMYIATKGEQAQ